MLPEWVLTNYFLWQQLLSGTFTLLWVVCIFLFFLYACHGASTPILKVLPILYFNMVNKHHKKQYFWYAFTFYMLLIVLTLFSALADCYNFFIGPLLWSNSMENVSTLWIHPNSNAPSTQHCYFTNYFVWQWLIEVAVIWLLIEMYISCF